MSRPPRPTGRTWPALVGGLGAALVSLCALPTPGPARGTPAAAQAPVPLGPLRAALRTGRCAEVPALHKKALPALRAPADRARADALLGEALACTGRLKEAQAALLAATAAAPTSLEARLALGLVYRRSGQHDRERQIWNRFFDDHDAGALDLKDPSALRHLGVAARYLGSYKDANDTLREAVALARQRRQTDEIVRANVEWAALFFEKYDAGDAEVSLKEALAQDPDNPDAHALYARVKLEQGNDVAGAEKEIAAALRTNPHHPGALAARAGILIDNEQYEDALKVTAQMLQADPADLLGRSLRAAALLLLERPADLAAEKAAVLRQDPRYTEMHRTIADLLVTQHRYDDAVGLLEEAVAIDPKDWYALSALGSGYLRLGQDDKGVQALQRAWKGDRFNVRTYNLLNLFEDVIPKKYELVTADIDPVNGKGKGGLRVRLPSAERALLLLPLLLPRVQKEWRLLTARYEFTPKLPLTLELYADPQHYAVRTVGLPGLAALGVTFGQVVTGRSPAQGAFNWGLMIWHEMSHVFAIQLSRSRVPRWFTEGLSEWETAHERPEWTRRTHAELYAALRDGALPSLSELNAGFSRARDVPHIVVAYHEAAAAVDFLIRRFGFPPIVRALKLFGKGQRTAEVLPQVTGMSMAALDAAFREDLKKVLAAYAGTFYVRPSDYSDVEGLEALLKDKDRPPDARSHGLYALALLSAGEADKAQAEADRGLKVDPGCRECLLAAADVLLRKKDWDGAERGLRTLLQRGGEGYDVRLRLGQIAAQRGDLAAAEAEFGKAKQLDPDRAEPYAELARLYTKNKREADALRELMGAADLEIMDGDLARTLVRRLHAAHRWADVVRYGELGRDLDPYNTDLRVQLGEALLSLGRRAEGQAELQAALTSLPTPSDEDEAAQLKAKRQEIEALQRRGPAPAPAPRPSPGAKK